MKITEQTLDLLRASLEGKMSEKRYRHTVEVERAAAHIAELYCPEKTMILRAAALLHDTTKEYTTEKHIDILSSHGVVLTDSDILAPKTLHARSAAVLIPEDYPELADDEVISCVRWHTTAHAGMTLTEKILYLADYIDESRRFRDCIILRGFFWGAHPENMNKNELDYHMCETLLMSYDMTVNILISEGTPISPDTILARNELIIQKIRLDKKEV